MDQRQHRVLTEDMKLVDVEYGRIIDGVLRVAPLDLGRGYPAVADLEGRVAEADAARRKHAALQRDNKRLKAELEAMLDRNIVL